MAGFLGMLTGGNANDRLNATRNEINAGRGRAQGEYTAGEATAQGYIQPWLDRGGRRMYDATLGLNGADPNEANKAYFNNRAGQEQLALQQKQRGWASNSRGGYGTATDSLAAARINAGDYEKWRNRLAGVADQELGAAGTAAGISQWGAAGRAGAEQGATNALAQIGTQQAQNENTLAQNLIGAGSTLASLYTGMPMRPAQRRGNNIGGYGDPFAG